MKTDMALNSKREHVHAALRSTALGAAIRQFDRHCSPESRNTTAFKVPVPIRTLNKPSPGTEVEIEFPKLKNISHAFIESCGFQLREGTYPGSSQGMITLPKEGLTALSFLLEKIPETAEGKEFFARALSFFGSENVIFDQIVAGLSPTQIAAGAILLKVATEGMSGLNGDLFLAQAFRNALERKEYASSDGIMTKAVDIQEAVLQRLTELVR